MERVKNYVAHDMVIISYFLFVLAYCLSCVISYIYIYIHIYIHIYIYIQFWSQWVFIPINMETYHWYLDVINADTRQIQVLDSMGLMCR